MTAPSTSALEQLLAKVSQLVDRIEAVLPQPLSAPDWGQAIAWRYRKRSSGHGVLEPVRHVAAMTLADLKEIDDQKEKLQRNTEQFVHGHPANNVLLTGARKAVVIWEIFSLKSPSRNPARWLSPAAVVLITIGSSTRLSKEMVPAWTPSHKPVRAEKSATELSVMKRISMFRPSAATSRTPSLSLSLSMARTPVFSDIWLMAVTTIERLSRVLFKTVVIVPDSMPLITTRPVTAAVPD